MPVTWPAATVELHAIYGVAFVMLGGAALLTPLGRQRSIARQLPWLGLFGLLHGLHLLLTAWLLLQPVEPLAARWAETATMILSYVALLEFARRAAAGEIARAALATRWAGWVVGPWVSVTLTLAVMAAMVFSSDPRMAGVSASHVLLCLPAGIVGGLALWRADGLDRFAVRSLSVALIGYGLTCLVPVAEAARNTSPATAATWGLWLEVLRASLAVVAALALAIVVRRRAASTLDSLEGEIGQARQALDAAQVGMSIAGPDGRIRYVNAAFVALWELRHAHDAVGRDPTEFWVHPAAAVAVVSSIEEQGSWEGSLEARTATGLEKTVSVSAIQLRDATGLPSGMLGLFRDDTDREALRRTVRDERVFAESMIDAMPALVVVLTLEGRIERVNPYFERLTGFRSDEIRGADWFDTFVPPRDRERIRALFSASVRGTSTRGNINAIVTRDGDEREIEWWDSLLRDADGVPHSLLAAGVDVTEALRTAKRLADSEARLRAIVAAEPECVKIVDAAGRLVEMNAAGLRLLEADGVDEVLGRPVADFINPEHIGAAAAALEAAFRGETTETAFEIVGLRGGRHWVEQSATPLWDTVDPTRVSGMLAVTRDVTRHREAQELLRESEARLREAQAIGGLGSWELDLRSERLVWSDEIFEIFGIDPAKFGASYDAFLATIHPDDRDRVNAAYTRAVEERTDYLTVHRLLTTDGRVKWVEERARTWYAEDGGAPLRSAGTVQDITDRVLAEERLRRSLSEKETLLREIHHRVKNNLQIIASLLYFQSKKVAAPEDGRIFLEGRDRLRAMILVHETLYQEHDLSRIAFAGYVRSLVVQLAESVGAAKQGVRVTVVASGDLKLTVDLAVPCGMLLTELVINAFKYAYPGGAGGEVRVHLASAGDLVEVTVADDGVGLPADFDPARTSSFGWQLIRTLVEQLGGTFEIAEGPGTTVRVSFALPAPTADRLAFSLTEEEA